MGVYLVPKGTVENSQDVVRGLNRTRSKVVPTGTAETRVDEFSCPFGTGS
jgi:hypothetical protein